MEYDLLKGFVFDKARRGKQLQVSESVCSYINERLDRINKQQAGRTEATEQFPSVNAKNEVEPGTGISV
jgi:hypothetical protein